MAGVPPRGAGGGQHCRPAYAVLLRCVTRPPACVLQEVQLPRRAGRGEDGGEDGGGAQQLRDRSPPPQPPARPTTPSTSTGLTPNISLLPRPPARLNPPPPETRGRSESAPFNPGLLVLQKSQVVRIYTFAFFSDAQGDPGCRYEAERGRRCESFAGRRWRYVARDRLSLN